MGKVGPLMAALLMWVTVGQAQADPGDDRNGSAPAAASSAAPDDTVRDNSVVESEIELRFTEDERFFGRGLDARAKAGTVVLVGTVKTAEDRERAAALAKVPGVVRVENHLEIEAPPAPERTKSANDPMTNEERERRRRAREATVAEGSPALPPSPTMPRSAGTPQLLPSLTTASATPAPSSRSESASRPSLGAPDNDRGGPAGTPAEPAAAAVPAPAVPAAADRPSSTVTLPPPAAAGLPPLAPAGSLPRR